MIALLTTAFLQVADPMPTVIPSDVVHAPTWEVRPSVGYPRIASSQGIAVGWALVRCKVADRRPRECQVLEESHPGMGFGPQAVEGLEMGRLSKDWVGNEEPQAAIQQLVRFKLAE